MLVRIPAIRVAGSLTKTIMTLEAVPHRRSRAEEAADSTERHRQPMYGAFYGLTEPPFDLSPDPRFLFLTPRQREALGNLHYGLSTSRGFTMLVGDAGTGKTTILRTALAGLADTNSRYVLISNPTLEKAEFYELLTRGFGLGAETLKSKATFLAELQDHVEARFAAGGLTGVIVDEAQSLPSELLEEIRLLGNIETTNTKLLNIVLAGQPELAERLNEPSLRQLKQRITLRCELRSLAANETAAYIAGRLRIAGGTPQEIFTHEAVAAIHRCSQGIPRTINVLCDNALITGFAVEAKPITAAIIEDVCRDFDLLPGAAVEFAREQPSQLLAASARRIAEGSEITTEPPPAPSEQQSDEPRPVRPSLQRELFAASQEPKSRFPFLSKFF
jgi:general secretion pathway protein A